VRATAVIALVFALACQPQPSVVRVGDLTVHLHLPADQAPLEGLVSLVLRVLDENGHPLAEHHYAPDDSIDFEVRPVGGVVEVVLEGFRDRSTLVARGSTGPVAADGRHAAGLFFGQRQSFGALAATALPAPVEHAAVSLAAGGVLFAGGQQGGSTLDRVWRYDPVTAQFADVGTLAVARTRIAAARLGDGRVLLVGGFDASGAPVAAIDVYEPDVDRVRAVSSTINAVGGACAAALSDGRVAVANGITGTGASDDLLIFDGSLGPPEPQSLSGPGRDRHACATLGEALFEIGGGGATSGTAAHFTAAGGSGLFSLPYGVVDATAFVDGSELAVVCGSERTAEAIAISAGGAAQISNRWRLDLARSGCTATPLRDGTLLVVGGRLANVAVAQAELAHADGDAAALSAPIEARSHHSATRLPGGEVLVVGGDGLPPRLYVP